MKARCEICRSNHEEEDYRACRDELVKKKDKAYAVNEHLLDYQKRIKSGITRLQEVILNHKKNLNSLYYVWSTHNKRGLCRPNETNEPLTRELVLRAIANVNRLVEYYNNHIYPDDGAEKLVRIISWDQHEEIRSNDRTIIRQQGDCNAELWRKLTEEREKK